MTSLYPSHKLMLNEQPASAVDLIHSLDWVQRYRRDLSALDTSARAWANEEEAHIRAQLAKRRGAVS